MRTINSNRQLNSPANSQETDKTKKIGLTSSGCKVKNLSTSLSSMTSSLKKNTGSQLKSSNKKLSTGLTPNTNSNKSLRGVK